MVRCRACGYIMKQGKLGDRCPACGAPRASFVPYEDPVAPARRKILKLQLHPIAVHFPTTFSVAALVFAIAIPILSGQARQLLLDTEKIITAFIPLLVLVALGFGWWDGKLRFRKIRNSRILQKKIVYASLLFVFSLALAFVVWLGGFKSAGASLGSIILAGGSAIFTFLLGLLGTSIVESIFPGK